MRKQLIYLIMAVSVGGFSSCNNGYENDFEENNREIDFRINISHTRTVTEEKVTTFVPEDRIGIFGIERGGTKVFNKNVEYTYTGENEWTAKPAITFPITGEEVDFYAYYPYGAYESTTFDFTVLTDQSADNGYAISDLLMAKNTTAQLNDEFIALQFTHAMAMIEVKPVFPEGADVELHTVKMTAVRIAEVDIVRQTANVKAGIEAEEITLCKVGEGVYRAVVPVQILKGRILEFAGINKSTGLSAIYDYSLTQEKTLVANSITTFTIHL